MDKIEGAALYLLLFGIGFWMMVEIAK